MLYRLLRDLAGQPAPGKDVGVGILGYAPSVGRLHGQGIAAPGLRLHSANAISARSGSAAAQRFPRRARAQGRGRAGARSRRAARHHCHCAEFPCPAVLQMMAAGKHVVCEKPLALNTKETAAMAEMASRSSCI